MKPSKTLIALLILLLAGSFSSVHSDGEQAHWSYQGDDGPDHWGELSPDFARCNSGQNQSPVDLVATIRADLPEIVFQYHGTPVKETNNGHTIMLTVNPGNYLEIPEWDMQFQFLQAHFHSPSEHTVNGQHFDMEIHLVHTGEDGGLTVVGVMISAGEENPMLNRIWSFMPDHEGETREAPVSVFKAGVLPPTRNYFSYNGSLTTPPCSEGVRWIILPDPLTASAGQIARFQERVGTITNRPVQPINSRPILN